MLCLTCSEKSLNLRTSKPPNVHQGPHAKYGTQAKRKHTLVVTSVTQSFKIHVEVQVKK